MQNSDLKTVAFPRLKNAGKCDNKVNPCFPIPVSLRHLRRTMYNVDPPNVDRPQNKASFANSVAPKIIMYYFEVYFNTFIFWVIMKHYILSFHAAIEILG